MQELSSTGSVVANMLTSLGIDEFLTRTDGSGTRSHLTDILGSTVAELDASVSTQASYTYEAFGKATVSGSSGNAFRYTGREEDGTGLYFYRARYYQPHQQRFVSEDPLEFGGGDGNLYAYVRSDPLNYRDELGLCVSPVGAVIIGTMSAVAAGMIANASADATGGSIAAAALVGLGTGMLQGCVPGLNAILASGLMGVAGEATTQILTGRKINVGALIGAFAGNASAAYVTTRITAGLPASMEVFRAAANGWRNGVGGVGGAIGGALGGGK